MVKQKVTIENPTGLHLRPAGLLCKEALRFQSSIKFEYGNTTANAKSVKCGDEIELICEGADEKEALETITELINGGLGE